MLFELDQGLSDMSELIQDTRVIFNCNYVSDALIKLICLCSFLSIKSVFCYFHLVLGPYMFTPTSVHTPSTPNQDALTL